MKAYSVQLPDGLRIRHPNPSHAWSMYREIFDDQVYAPPDLRLDPGSTVLDVGAHVGLFSLFCLQRYPSCRVFALEPAPPIYELLCANLAQCRPCTTLCCAVGESPGLRPFTFYPNMAGMSGFSANPALDMAAAAEVVSTQQVPDCDKERMSAMLRHAYQAETLAARVVTLSWLIHEHRIARVDLLKMDVEGSEVDALRGVAVDDWRRIEQCAIEVHSDDLLRETESILESRGFRVRITENNRGEAGTMRQQQYVLFGVRMPER